MDAAVNVVQALLKAGAEVNAADNQRWTPLHFAAQEFNVENARALVGATADLEAEDVYGNTPLWRATFASKGRGDVVVLLLHAGADRHHANKSGNSPLQLANRIANYGVAQFFQDES